MAPDDTGYTGMMLKSRGAKNLFIAPIQEELSTNPLPLTDEAFSNMPKATCQKCGVAVPLPLLTEHIKSCDVMDVGSDNNLANVETSALEERKCKNSYYSLFVSMLYGINNRNIFLKITLFLPGTSQQQICRNVLSAQICFLLTSLRYMLHHVWKGIYLLFIVNVFFSFLSLFYMLCSCNTNNFMRVGQEKT